jgi:hypothetical protein
MTYKVHGYVGDKKVINWRMAHLPRCGDTIRMTGERYSRVTEVIWCLDEESLEGQRVNLRMEAIE